jgi:hypothetical protein
MPDPTYTHAVTSDEHVVILEDVTAPLVADGEGPIHIGRIMFTYGRVTAADPNHEYPALALGDSNWHHYRHRPEWKLGGIDVEGVYTTRDGGRSQFDAYESWSIGLAGDDPPTWLLDLASRFLPHGERTARVLPGEPTDTTPGG